VSAALHTFCTFWVDEQLFGVDVAHVQEVVSPQRMTHVPLAPGHVRGLLHLRGQIVTAVDLRAQLALPPMSEEQHMNVVLRHEGRHLGLLVDRVGDVLEVDAACFARPPQHLPPAVLELVAGVYQLPQQLLLSLEVESLMRSV